MAYTNFMKKELLRQNLRAYFLDREAIHYNRLKVFELQKCNP